jgi:hypothetical protein
MREFGFFDTACGIDLQPKEIANRSAIQTELSGLLRDLVEHDLFAGGIPDGDAMHRFPLCDFRHQCQTCLHEFGKLP